MNKCLKSVFVFAALAFNTITPMIKLKQGIDKEKGSYTSYVKEVDRGIFEHCIHFEQLSKCETFIVELDADNNKKVLKRYENTWNDFGVLAKKYALQQEESEKKEGANTFLAMLGKKFAIEWYYDAKGISQAREYYQDLEPAQQRKLDNLFEELAGSGSITGTNRFRDEKNGIFAFKPMPDRFLCFFHKDAKVIVTNAFKKRTDKLDPAEKNTALKAQDDYEQRVIKKIYYSK